MWYLVSPHILGGYLVNIYSGYDTATFPKVAEKSRQTSVIGTNVLILLSFQNAIKSLIAYLDIGKNKQYAQFDRILINHARKIRISW